MLVCLQIFWISWLAWISVARLRINKVVIKKMIQRVECGPLIRILVPTLEHHGVVGVRAEHSLRPGHAIVVFFDFVDDLRMSHARVRIGTQRNELVEKNAEGPHVRFDGVCAQSRVRIHGEDFGRCPFYFYEEK